MKKTAAVLCTLMLFLTGCHKNNFLHEWKQSYDEWKFEAEMTAKADGFIQWYFDGAKKAVEEDEDEDTNFDPEGFDLIFVRLGVENKSLRYSVLFP